MASPNGREEGGWGERMARWVLLTLVLAAGDILPTSGWLRILVPLEALIGFGLFTAAVSWLLSIYPDLSRRQVVAHEVTLVRESERETGSAVREVSVDAADRMLISLTTQLVTIQGDLVQFPIICYFHSSDERHALPAVMPYLVRLAENGGGGPSLGGTLGRPGAGQRDRLLLEHDRVVLPRPLVVANGGRSVKAYARARFHATRKGGR